MFTSQNPINNTPFEIWSLHQDVVFAGTRLSQCTYPQLRYPCRATPCWSVPGPSRSPRAPHLSGSPTRAETSRFRRRAGKQCVLSPRPPRGPKPTRTAQTARFLERGTICAEYFSLDFCALSRHTAPHTQKKRETHSVNNTARINVEHE